MAVVPQIASEKNGRHHTGAQYTIDLVPVCEGRIEMTDRPMRRCDGAGYIAFLLIARIAGTSAVRAARTHRDMRRYLLPMNHLDASL